MRAAVLCTVFIWGLALTTLTLALLDSARVGGARTALDVEISWENIARDGSAIRSP